MLDLDSLGWVHSVRLWCFFRNYFKSFIYNPTESLMMSQLRVSVLKEKHEAAPPTHTHTSESTPKRSRVKQLDSTDVGFVGTTFSSVLICLVLMVRRTAEQETINVCWLLIVFFSCPEYSFCSNRGTSIPQTSSSSPRHYLTSFSLTEVDSLRAAEVTGRFLDLLITAKHFTDKLWL